MASQGYIPILTNQTAQRYHYTNVNNHNYYNIQNNYNGDYYDHRRMNNRYHHRHPQSPRYHTNNYSHSNSNRHNSDYDLTISSTYNDGKNLIYPYLESKAITAWFTANTNDTFDVLSKPYIHHYILDASTLYDERYRNVYELSLWEEYLEMTNENKYLAEEVLWYTETRNFKTNMSFIQKQINQFQDEISEINRDLNDITTQFISYWHTDRSIPIRRLLDSSLDTEETTPPPTTTTTTQKPTIKCPYQLNSCIKEYITQCTQYAKKLTDTKIQLAQAQLEDFRQL